MRKECAMNGNLHEFFHHIKVGAKQRYANMTLYCFLAAHDSGVDFLTMD